MHSMIYYPGFEIENEKWLKFALLYFEELRPIIPYMNVPEHMYLSDTTREIIDKTNLIRPYRPTYDEGYCASVIACKEFEEYLKNPTRYSYAFTKKHTVDMASQWKNEAMQTCSLYEGKFSNEFHKYCLENGIARPFESGIMISKDLAFVYMSLLADVISKSQEIEMFTDINQYDNLLLINDKQIAYSQKLQYKIAKTQIEFAVPTKIEHIPLDTIIKLRNNRDFKGCRTAYVKEMEKYLKAKETDPNYSFDEQLRLKKELHRIIEVSIGTACATFLSCSTVSSLMEGNISSAQALAATYSNLSTFKKIKNMPEYICNMNNKIQAKRYVGQIRRACNKYINKTR